MSREKSMLRRIGEKTGTISAATLLALSMGQVAYAEEDYDSSTGDKGTKINEEIEAENESGISIEDGELQVGYEAHNFVTTDGDGDDGEIYYDWGYYYYEQDYAGEIDYTVTKVVLPEGYTYTEAVYRDISERYPNVLFISLPMENIPFESTLNEIKIMNDKKGTYAYISNLSVAGRRILEGSFYNFINQETALVIKEAEGIMEDGVSHKKILNIVNHGINLNLSSYLSLDIDTMYAVAVELMEMGAEIDIFDINYVNDAGTNIMHELKVRIENAGYTRDGAYFRTSEYYQPQGTPIDVPSASTTPTEPVDDVVTETPDTPVVETNPSTSVDTPAESGNTGSSTGNTTTVTESIPTNIADIDVDISLFTLVDQSTLYPEDGIIGYLSIADVFDFVNSRGYEYPNQDFAAGYLTFTGVFNGFKEIQGYEYLTVEQETQVLLEAATIFKEILGLNITIVEDGVIIRTNDLNENIKVVIGEEGLEYRYSESGEVVSDEVFEGISLEGISAGNYPQAINIFVFDNSGVKLLARQMEIIEEAKININNWMDYEAEGMLELLNNVKSLYGAEDVADDFILASKLYEEISKGRGFSSLTDEQKSQALSEVMMEVKDGLGMDYTVEDDEVIVTMSNGVKAAIYFNGDNVVVVNADTDEVLEQDNIDEINAILDGSVEVNDLLAAKSEAEAAAQVIEDTTQADSQVDENNIDGVSLTSHTEDTDISANELETSGSSLLDFILDNLIIIIVAVIVLLTGIILIIVKQGKTRR